MSNTTSNADLRKSLRQRRAAIKGTMRQNLSRLATANALASTALQASSHVGVFLSFAEEIDTRPLIEALWRAGKKLYLPYVYDRDAPLHWLSYSENEVMGRDLAHIPTPIYRQQALFPVEQLNLIVTPLLGWTSRGHRLGMGGGYYDRTFALTKAYRLGFAYQCQQAEFFPQPWDKALQALATEEQLLTF